MIGSIKISRTFEDCEDRISKTPWCDKQFMYKTVMRDTNIEDSDLVASLALVHGFGQNTNICFFEAMIQFALNGFEVTSVD
jgi:hypothetical protein